MNKVDIKEIILDGQASFQNRNYIPRELQLPLTELKSLEKIIAITGPRRAGKTYYLKQIFDNLKLAVNETVFLDFSEAPLSDFSYEDFKLLSRAYREIFPELKPVFFLDEIQEVVSFESGLKYLLNQGYQIFITGSSSQLMIDDLAESLRGKVLYYHLYPLSFGEYLKFKDYSLPSRDTLSTSEAAILYNHLENYLYWGGFPEVVLARDDELKKNLLSSYIDTMLLRDIIKRRNIKNIHLIEQLFWKLTKSFTKEISINKWYNDFKSQGLKVSRDTLYIYLKYFEETLFFFFLSNHNKGSTGSRKVYLIDNGIYNHVRGIQRDMGKSFENQVFIDLKRRNYRRLSFQKTPQWETDFLADDDKYQVCYSLDKENINRELKGLADYSKAKIITFDENSLSQTTPSSILYWKWVLKELNQVITG